MATTLVPLGPVSQVLSVRTATDGRVYITDVILCNDTLGFILGNFADVLDDGSGHVLSNSLYVYTVNPLTGAEISQRRYDLPVGVAWDHGQWKRLDDTTACFAWWDYGGAGSGIGRGGSGDLVFGTLTATAFVMHRHPIDSPEDVEHFKDTGQSVYVDTVTRTGSVMYFPLYHFDFTNRHFVTSARAVVFDFTTGASHEYPVTVNMGPDSDRSAYPQYYGTVPLPNGRVLSVDLTGTVRDQDSHVVDRIHASSLDKEAVDFDAGWVYQVGGTNDLMILFTLDARPNRFPIYAQRYVTTPAFAPVGPPVLLAHDQVFRSNAEFIFVSGITDEMDPISGQIRVANLPYFDVNNRVGDSFDTPSQSFYIGAQSLRDGTRATKTITVPTPNDTFWSHASTPASMTGDGSTVHILYTFNWFDITVPTDNTMWFQLWAASSGEGSPMRISQRDDGLASTGGPRLPQLGARSVQGSNPPRVGSANTYH